MTRLPKPGGDDGDWGDILNAYLEISLNSDGTIKNNAVGTNQIAGNAVTNAQLDSATQSAVSKANSSVQTVNSKTPTAGDVTLSASDVSAIPTSQKGAASGVATLDGSSTLTSSQLPSSVVTDSRVPEELDILQSKGGVLVPVPTPMRAELYAIYNPTPDGAVPANADSGQPWTIYGGTENVALEIKNGALTTEFSTAIQAAGYFGADLTGPVKRMGAEFTFDQAVANQDGSVTLAAWTTALDSLPVGSRSSPAHVSVTPVSWSLLVWESGVYTNLVSEYFPTPLTTDGSTVYRLEWFILGDTCYIALPDGQFRTVTDSRIGSINASWATPEIFFLNASDIKIAISRVWADSREDLPVQLAPSRREVLEEITDRVSSQVQVVGVTYAPTTDSSVVVPGISTVVDATNLTVTVMVPASGKILVQQSGYLTIAAAVVVYWTLMHGATSYGSTDRIIDTSSFKGRISRSQVISGLTPGSLTLDFAHFLTGTAGGATLNLCKTNGQTATLVATPLP